MSVEEMFVDRYAGLIGAYNYNLHRAEQAIKDEFEDNDPINEDDVENRKSEVLPGWVHTYRDKVLTRIDEIYNQIERPSREDSATRERLVSQINARFDGLTANINAVCNAALERVRAEQAPAQQVERAERAELVDESSEDEGELMEDLESEEEFGEAAPPEFPSLDHSQIEPQEKDKLPPAA